MVPFLLILCCQRLPEENSSKKEVPLSMETYQQALDIHSLTEGKPILNGIQVPVPTQFGVWQLSIQYFAQKKILYLAINDYLWLDSSANPQSTVFAMTQMLTQNHGMVGGKFQINPSSGAITIGIELVVNETIQKIELQNAISILLENAKDNYPMIKTALGKDFY
jgi:hypothetical protein